MTTLCTTTDSPLGELLLVGERSPGAPGGTAPGGTALASLSVPGQRGGATVRPGWAREPDAFTAIAEQLTAYFAGYAGGLERKQLLLAFEGVALAV